MKKFRTYKQYTLVYDLEREGMAFRISIEKDGVNGFENSSYVVNGEEKELKALLCRLWACGVTPMSLIYILEDEGYIPGAVDEDSYTVKEDKIVKRNQSCVGKTISALNDASSDLKPLAIVGGDSDV